MHSLINLNVRHFFPIEPLWPISNLNCCLWWCEKNLWVHVKCKLFFMLLPSTRLFMAIKIFGAVHAPFFWMSIYCFCGFHHTCFLFYQCLFWGYKWNVREKNCSVTQILGHEKRWTMTITMGRREYLFRYSHILSFYTLSYSKIF